MLLDTGAVLSAFKGRSFWCPKGTIENSPAFQRWVGRQKVASPEGTTEGLSHSPSFSRAFGTCMPCGIVPGVKTPGYSQDVPPGQRNVASVFSAKQATRFIDAAFKAFRDHSVQRGRCGTHSARGEGWGEGKTNVAHPTVQ